jgi:superfamily II DNA or RNA helicase
VSHVSPIALPPGGKYPCVILRQQDEWGLVTLDLVSPPRRLLGAQSAGFPTVEQGVDAKRVEQLPTPATILQRLPEDDTWTAQSKRSIARLAAYFLICEDPQRRLDAREVSTLAHQVSLVRHILDHEHLRRVLIADEVGLGKTIEAGLLIQELVEASPPLRVLYLCPARLVTNVRREFDRLGLGFRQWSSAEADARLTDTRILASIHRAVHPRHRQQILSTDPWDVIVVDECHHLSDWGFGGGDPREQFKLVRDLIAKQTTDGRVLFLSGTPHQGHVSRFENLLNLLRGAEESSESLNGRVIYRTKDDIRDWEGRLLFPTRIVNEPLVVDLGPEYKRWIGHIYDFFRPIGDDNDDNKTSRRRAAGWRCAQALQWAASSPQAGLGYLVRQALRAEWSLKDEPLPQCLKALRPYRSGSPDEPVERLFQRMLKEVQRQQNESDVEDIEDELARDVPRGVDIDRQLSALLNEGLRIVARSAHDKWTLIMDRVLKPAGLEKMVLFAQPIETVTALAAFLERETGEKPALICGGQSDAERDQEVQRFRNPDGPRFLVSSRAGGEGINLQVARHLVHVDVPWNPMDMEQRVGRIHRFGSRRNVIVDTIVVKDSREADAYRIAREKLRLIASTMVEPERFEAVFSRVMCLLPPEELQDVLIQDALGPFTSHDQEQIARIVRDGYNKWRDFDEKFSLQQKQIHEQDPGLANWTDVADFLRTYGKADSIDGFATETFELKGGTVQPVASAAAVVKMPDGDFYACSDVGGMPVYGPSGQIAKPVGLNLDDVQELMRRLAFPERPTGAAHLRWSDEAALPAALSATLFGLMSFVRQTVKTDLKSGWSEVNSSLRVFHVVGVDEPVEMVQADKRLIVDGLLRATVRTKPATANELVARLADLEDTLAQQLRRPTDAELAAGVRHAVMPVFVAIVETEQ